MIVQMSQRNTNDSYGGTNTYYKDTIKCTMFHCMIGII